MATRVDPSVLLQIPSRVNVAFAPTERKLKASIHCSQLSAAPVISGTWEYLRHDYLQKSASQVRSTSM